MRDSTIIGIIIVVVFFILATMKTMTILAIAFFISLILALDKDFAHRKSATVVAVLTFSNIVWDIIERITGWSSELMYLGLFGVCLVIGLIAVLIGYVMEYFKKSNKKDIDK